MKILSLAPCAGLEPHISIIDRPADVQPAPSEEETDVLPMEVGLQKLARVLEEELCLNVKGVKRETLLMTSSSGGFAPTSISDTLDSAPRASSFLNLRLLADALWAYVSALIRLCKTHTTTPKIYVLHGISEFRTLDQPVASSPAPICASARCALAESQAYSGSGFNIT
ncbi:hypothetical protein FPV67DRAFT_1677691 [Lyophyllum atratum]|nr:hypothetical protein FPV67DRAFT_1677691 [Lyophyllum atratum]